MADEERTKVGPLVDTFDPIKKTAETWAGKAYLKWLDLWRWARPKLPPFFAGASGLLGWAAVSMGLFYLIGHQWVLWVCFGLLLLSGLGWRTIADLVWDGIYIKWLRDQEENQG